MKRFLSIWVAVFALTAALTAEEVKKDLAYYDAGFRQTGDVRYLQERCKLDLRIPSGVKGFPTVVWFHGGGLTGGSKYIPHFLDARKVAVAAVNYRLSGKRASCPDYLYDAAAATAWVIKHIAEYGGDPRKVYISGHSAGGYLCAMLAFDGRYLKEFGVTPLQLAGVIPLSGQMTTHFRILAERRAKEPNTPEVLLDEYAPIFVAKKEAPPVVLIVGDTNIEWPARVEENYLLYARLRRVLKNEKVKIYSLSGFNHGTMLKPGLILANNLIIAECYPKR